MSERTYEYTYMRPNGGYPDDFAGLPSRDRSYAKYIASQFPGQGRIFKRVVASRWEEVENDSEQ